jgi:hypothetical protein
MSLDFALAHPQIHPKIREIHAYWLGLHPAPGVLPDRRAIDPIAIRAVLPNLFLLDASPPPLRLRYRLVGTKLVQAGGRELTGRLMEDAHPNLLLAEPYADYPACAREARIGWRRGPTVFDWDRQHVQIERILLPLATDGRTVDVILGLSVFLDSNGREL